MTTAAATSASWANPHLHPWFRMPSLKRKDLSNEEEDEQAFYHPRRSLSPAPSPKRRRCDVLETGLSQLTLDMDDASSSARWGAASSPDVSASANTTTYLAPTVSSPDTSTVAAPTFSSWADSPYALHVTQIPTNAAITVVHPGSVEEPASPESAAAEGAYTSVDVSMKGPSWYEIEKDRIVITNLEDSDTDTEDEDSRGRSTSTPVDAPASATFTISSALLDRLPKPHALGPLSPPAHSHPSAALVLYRPIVVPAEPRGNESDDDSRPPARFGVLASDYSEEANLERRLVAEEVPYGEDEDDEDVQLDPEPMGEEVPMEDTRPFTPIVEAGGEAVDEPMDIEML